MNPIAQAFAQGLNTLIAVQGNRPITVIDANGNVKYSTVASQGVAPRSLDTANSYDQTRVQFTHPGAAGTPTKFDKVNFNGVTRSIEEVRPQDVGGVVIGWRIIVAG